MQDTTTWTFDPATGLELSKTYADNTAVVKTYVMDGTFYGCKNSELAELMLLQL